MERRRSFQTIIFLLLALLNTNLEARISLQKINSALTSAGKIVQSRVNTIHKYLDSEEGSAQMEAVDSSLEKIGEAISSLTSGDTTEIVSGTLTVISAATSLIPVVGPIISTVFSLIGTIFGAIAGGSGATEDVGTIVKREIENALNKYEDSQLKAEAEGAMRVYRISHAYLASKEGDTPVNEHEIAALFCSVPVYQGIGFLGMLSQKVSDNSKSNDIDQVKRAMEYLQLYVTLAIMRSSILWEMYALVRAIPDTNFTAAAIHRVIIAEDDHDKSFLNFLQEPDYPQAVFFANFNVSEWPTTITFIEKKGFIYQHQRHDYLANGTFSLKPEKWTNKYMVMWDNVWGPMHAWDTLDARSQFYFDPISSENNVFHLIRYLEGWDPWYVYMKDEDEGYCRGSPEKPGPAGEWKVIRFKDGKYMFTPNEWPNKFIYMMDDHWGHIRGSVGDPNIQGHWLIYSNRQIEDLANNQLGP